MQKSRIVVVALAAFASFACASQSEPRTVASGAGCAQLGDTQAAATGILSSGNVYAAHRAAPHPYAARGQHTGVDLLVHATPGTSREYVERSLSCHAQFGRALNESDPLHPQSGRVADVDVRSLPGGYAVRVLGEGRAVNEEIYQRARSLAGSGSVQVEQ
ncbi:MAG TPA: hypothetical protein VK524_10890, partial [Polyangiaceae bacterium]|nr:hypothetical protein [Polyangiaceae bacterium]